MQILSENYVPAAQRYITATEQIAEMKAEQDIMKNVLLDHGKKLKMIS